MIMSRPQWVREKISQSMKGKKNALGYKHPSEFGRAVSERLKGQPSHEWTEESREKARQKKLGTHPSEETRQKLKLAQLGPKHWRWRGGEKRYVGIDYKNWRKAIFERDNYTCQICGARNGNGKSIQLNADHIKPWADYPELRFDIDNGRTLCIECHRETDTYGRKLVMKHREDESYA
jgi:5-methylcytosine-specific restriction endonuclease McrA